MLNEARKSLARHYLRGGNLSATEIAHLLGYDEPSSFYRAYHSWTGQTPAPGPGCGAATTPTTATIL